MARMSYPEAPIVGLDAERRKLAEATNGAIRGKTNNVITVTLTANAASTTIASPLIGPNSALLWSPTTANAAAISTPYPSSRTSGSAVIAHANDANADKTFEVVIVG